MNVKTYAEKGQQYKNEPEVRTLKQIIYIVIYALDKHLLPAYSPISGADRPTDRAPDRIKKSEAFDANTVWEIHPFHHQAVDAIKFLIIPPPPLTTIQTEANDGIWSQLPNRIQSVPIGIQTICL